MCLLPIYDLPLLSCLPVRLLSSVLGCSTAFLCGSPPRSWAALLLACAAPLLGSMSRRPTAALSTFPCISRQSSTPLSAFSTTVLYFAPKSVCAPALWLEAATRKSWDVVVHSQQGNEEDVRRVCYITYRRQVTDLIGKGDIYRWYRQYNRESQNSSFVNSERCLFFSRLQRASNRQLHRALGLF